ncbi:MAG: hypothetical protein AAB480_00685, partial [Patescibacteria group bacterium]
MKTKSARIIIPLAVFVACTATFILVHADSITLGSPFWVTSNWSNTTSPPRGAQASANNDGITCPNGSVQTGWRILGDSAPYSGSEYGTQCRQPSSTVTTGARTWVTSNWSNSTSPTFGAQASPNDGIACSGGFVQTGWRIVAIDPGMGVYEYGTQCQPLVSSVTLGAPYWVTSNSSGGTMPFGAASPNNNGITCPNGSVQTGWRIIYTSSNDAYGPEGSGGSYDSYEYGTQCRPISQTVTPPPSSCNVVQSYTAPGTYTSPVSGTYTLQVIGGGGGAGGNSLETGNIGSSGKRGGPGGKGAPTSITGSFGTITAQGGAGGAGVLSQESSSGAAGVAGGSESRTVTLQAGEQLTVSIGGGGGGGGAGGIAGNGPAGSDGAAGPPSTGGAGGVGAAVCAWYGNGHSGPAGSGGSGGVSSGGGGGAGSSGDNGSYGCAAGSSGGAGTLSQGGFGGKNGGYYDHTKNNAAGGMAPGGGGAAPNVGGGGGGGASGAVRICSNTSAISCSVTFDQNPLTGANTTMR